MLFRSADILPIREKAHGKILAGVTKELDETDFRKPVVIVRHDGGAGAAVEVQKALQLFFDAFDVVLHLFSGQQLSFLGLAGGVSDQSGPAPRECDRLVSELLKPCKPHDRNHVADMETVGARVEPHVPGDGLV